MFDFDEICDETVEDALVGNWVYVGCKGRTEYHIKRVEDSSLWFEGPDASGASLSGVMKPQGRWLQAELLASSGAAVGTVRVSFDAEKHTAISNFRNAGKTKWGKDIIAHRVTRTTTNPDDCSKPTDAIDKQNMRTDATEGDLFIMRSGYISPGDVLLVEKMTVFSAKVKCRDLPECKGFCFKGQNTEHAVTVYFKKDFEVIDMPLDEAIFTVFCFLGEPKPRPEVKVPVVKPTPEAEEESKEWKIARARAKLEAEQFRLRAQEHEQDYNSKFVPGMLGYTGTGRGWIPSAARLPPLQENLVAYYLSNGFAGPLSALSSEEVCHCQEGLQRFVDGHCNGHVSNANTLQNHMTLPWLYDLAMHPKIIGAVASALRTDNVLLFSSCLFLRDPGCSCESQLGVGWHEDGVLYSRILTPMEDWITAFVALTPCKRSDGCLQYIPFRMTRGPNFDDKQVPHMELQPGQFSIHNAKVTHRAGTNYGHIRRDCVALRYVSGRVRDLVADANENAYRDSAVLCCGRYPEAHFSLLTPPVLELDEKDLNFRNDALKLRAERYGTTVFSK